MAGNVHSSIRLSDTWNKILRHENCVKIIGEKTLEYGYAPSQLAGFNFGMYFNH